MANLKDLLVNGVTNFIGRVYAQTPTTGTSDRQVATTEFVLNNCYKPSLLSFMWSDHLLNDISWLRADTFSWQDGTTYSLIYNELLSEYNNSASVEETEGSITFKRTPKGYKIALATQETAILNKYNSDGIAWYYILDTTNTRFKLPRTKWGFEGLRTTVGSDISESLPNITGSFGCDANDLSAAGCFIQSIGTVHNIGGGSNDAGLMSFNASRSSSVYKDNAPVQERATQMYLYFYVGQFTESAEAQTAGLNSELFNGKVDLNFNNMNPSQTAKNTIAGWGMPDYSASVAVTMPYTAPSNGWFVASNQSTSTIVKINNVQVAQGNWDPGAWSGNLNCQIMVTKDDVITGATGTMYFMPCKGVN